MMIYSVSKGCLRRNLRSAFFRRPDTKQTEVFCMLSRKEIKSLAKHEFVQNYWQCVGACAVVGILIGFVGCLTAGIGALVLVPPFIIGRKMFFLNVYNGKTEDMGTIFPRAFENYGHKLGGYLWMSLFTFLWSLLFIVPGIIKSYAYALTPYILDDCKNVRAKDALKLSMRMMKGYKWKLFVFELSFLGWRILSALTSGILGAFLVNPYHETALAGFYQERKLSALDDGIVSEDELNGEPLEE